jgi:pterin-4a-carbinolamine dehydratase
MKFDFSKSPIQNINKLKENYDVELDVPVKVEKNDWQMYDTRQGKGLARTYYFKNYKHLMYFFTEIVKELSDTKNIPVIIVRDLEVTVKIESDFLGDITSLELNISKFIEEIYEDIRYI